MERIKLRKKTLYSWLAIVMVLLLIYKLNKEIFDIKFLTKYVDDNKGLVITIYLIILTLIGLTFIPSTPIAIVGILLFPPLEAFAINMIGIFTSSLVVYYFTRYLRLDRWIESKYPEKIEKIRNALKHKEMPIIAGWSIFPVVPTDLIIYVSGTLSIPFWKCAVGILNAFYIFSLDFFI